MGKGRKEIVEVLVIDNGTKYRTELEQACVPHSPTVVDRGSYYYGPDNFDVAILSGSHTVPVSQRLVYQEVLKLITESSKPIVGSCLGAQLIVSAFGGEVAIHKPFKGPKRINIITDDQIFEGISDLVGFSNHRRVLREIPPELVVLAQSECGPEIVRHRELPIYGCLFHPEVDPDTTSGRKLFENFFKIAELVNQS